jgi:hypothetical protein
MEDITKNKIVGIINKDFANKDRHTTCVAIMEGFIFGKYAKNQHYTIDEICAIWNELNTPILVEEPPVTEEV